MSALGSPAVERWSSRLGIAAFAAIALGCLWAAIGYTGKAGEPYSPLNHWISELGEEGVSARATGFNLSLIAGGAAFVGFVAGLARSSPSRLRWVFGPVGVVAGIGGSMVGVFPMNHPDAHLTAAFTFFCLGWVFVALASFAFIRHRQPWHPAWLAVPGAASVVAFLAFLVSVQLDPATRERMASHGPIVARPDLWIAPILEWASLVSIMVWVLLTSITWWRLRRDPA
jgi:hypothetical membrane protein